MTKNLLICVAAAALLTIVFESYKVANATRTTKKNQQPVEQEENLVKKQQWMIYQWLKKLSRWLASMFLKLKGGWRMTVT